MFSRLLVTFSIFTQLASAASAEEVWKIGALLCLSGECAADGESALRGAQIAVHEINTNGGVLGKKLELIVKDTVEAVSGLKTLTAYKELRRDREVQFIVGPTWTPGGLSLVPELKRDTSVIITSPSLGAAEFHLSGENVFNSHGTDESTTRMTARHAYRRGFRKMAVFSSEQPWESMQADFFQDEFEKLGGRIVVRVEPLPTVNVLSSEALRIISSRPDAVFLATVNLQSIAAKELRKLNFNGGKFAAMVDEARLHESDGALEGTEFFTFQKPTKEYGEKFKAVYGKLPEIPSATGYDTVYSYVLAAEKAGTTDPDSIKRELLKLSFDGASGKMQYDREGCVEKEASGWRVVGSTLLPL